MCLFPSPAGRSTGSHQRSKSSLSESSSVQTLRRAPPAGPALGLEARRAAAARLRTWRREPPEGPGGGRQALSTGNSEALIWKGKHRASSRPDPLGHGHLDLGGGSCKADG